MALALPKENYLVQHLIYRGDRERAETVQESLPNASMIDFDRLSALDTDILIIATQDSEISFVGKEVEKKLNGKPFVFHTSGALSSNLLDNLRGSGCSVASMHPLISISRPDAGIDRFRGVYFCIEGDDDAVSIADEVVKSLGGIAFSIDTEFKTLYHAAAVTACGHFVALFDVAVEMMSKTGLSRDESKKILLPLVKSTVENLAVQQTEEALTGPFARADVQTLDEHLKILKSTVSQDLFKIYLILGERSLGLATEKGLDPAKIDSMLTRISMAKSKLKW